MHLYVYIYMHLCVDGSAQINDNHLKIKKNCLKLYNSVASNFNISAKSNAAHLECIFYGLIMVTWLIGDQSVFFSSHFTFLEPGASKGLRALIIVWSNSHIFISAF